MEHLYWRWGRDSNGQGAYGIWTRVDGQDVLTEELDPLPFMRAFNPFNDPVLIYGTTLYLHDSVPAVDAFYALQRASDYAMLRVSFALGGVAGGAESVPGGPMLLLPTDALLEENGKASNGQRSFGVTLHYEVVP